MEMRKYRSAAAASKVSIFSPGWHVRNVQFSSTDGGQGETEELAMAYRSGVVLLTGLYSGQY